MATFALPVVEQNSDGWGPTDVSPELKNVPFAPFSKSDKLGKASDWTNTSYQRMHGGVAPFAGGTEVLRARVVAACATIESASTARLALAARLRSAS